jgi:hypothetical protein
MNIIRASRSISCPADPARIAAALAQLAEREDLDASERAGVLCVALTWPPSRPRDAVPLLRSFAMAR